MTAPAVIVGVPSAVVGAMAPGLTVTAPGLTVGVPSAVVAAMPLGLTVTAPGVTVGLPSASVDATAVGATFWSPLPAAWTRANGWPPNQCFAAPVSGVDWSRAATG